MPGARLHDETGDRAAARKSDRAEVDLLSAKIFWARRELARVVSHDSFDGNPGLEGDDAGIEGRRVLQLDGLLAPRDFGPRPRELVLAGVQVLEDDLQPFRADRERELARLERLPGTGDLGEARERDLHVFFLSLIRRDE